MKIKLNFFPFKHSYCCLVVAVIIHTSATNLWLSASCISSESSNKKRKIKNKVWEENFHFFPTKIAYNTKKQKSNAMPWCLFLIVSLCFLLHLFFFLFLLSAFFCFSTATIAASASLWCLWTCLMCLKQKQY